MNKKRIIISLSLVVAVIFTISAGVLFNSKGLTAYAAYASRYEQLSQRNKGFEERAKAVGQADIKHVEVLRPANKDQLGKIKPIDEMQGYVKDENLKNGAVYEKKELLTYEEFINKYEADLDPAISKDRMIRVTVTHYPNGFQHKKGFVKNAILTRYYDAETGELYGYGLKSLDKDGYGITKGGSK